MSFLPLEEEAFIRELFRGDPQRILSKFRELLSQLEQFRLLCEGRFFFTAKKRQEIDLEQDITTQDFSLRQLQQKGFSLQQTFDNLIKCLTANVQLDLQRMEQFLSSPKILDDLPLIYFSSTSGERVWFQEFYLRRIMEKFSTKCENAHTGSFECTKYTNGYLLSHGYFTGICLLDLKFTPLLQLLGLDRNMTLNNSTYEEKLPEFDISIHWSLQGPTLKISNRHGIFLDEPRVVLTSLTFKTFLVYAKLYDTCLTKTLNEVDLHDLFKE